MSDDTVSVLYASDKVYWFLKAVGPYITKFTNHNVLNYKWKGETWKMTLYARSRGSIQYYLWKRVSYNSNTEVMISTIICNDK